MHISDIKMKLEYTLTLLREQAQTPLRLPVPQRMSRYESLCIFHIDL